ncbi:hypothetical protein M9H77_08113 [Catharanthus roseus]|uniref:Uncharacterized protein n=1 Tax=Catharanthus roseus TaxID=4058 RepID=A0ACC0BX67_CATRO|nr:hypothetical protein M9H77_08113 [Catharanthus roseus]
MAENPRALREYLTPNTYNSAIGNKLPEIEANHFEIKVSIIQILPYFYGLDYENPYKHIDEFLEICSTFKLPNVSDDAIRLRLFPFSLKDKAKHWLHTRKRIALNILPTNSPNVQSVCTICSSPSHVIYDYPSASLFPEFVQEQINATQGFHRQNDPYSNTYNPGWKNHSNFSWMQQGGKNSHTQSIARLETKIGQLPNAISRRDEVWTGRFFYFASETTNRAERKYALLKAWIETSHNDLDTVFLKIDFLIEGQITDITTTLEYSQMKEKDNGKSNLVIAQVCYNIGHLALKIIKDEIMRAPKILVIQKFCVHTRLELHTCFLVHAS